MFKSLHTFVIIRRFQKLPGFAVFTSKKKFFRNSIFQLKEVFTRSHCKSSVHRSFGNMPKRNLADGAEKHVSSSDTDEDDVRSPTKKQNVNKKKESSDLTSNSNKTSENSLDFCERIVQKRQNTVDSVAKFKFQKKRVKILSKSQDVEAESKGILYWMSRDQRVQDNWAFLYAQRLALKLEIPLHVCFCLVPKFLDATIRHYGFLIKGLKEVEKECRDLDITFHLFLGPAVTHVPEFVKENNIGGVVTDFSPLRVPRSWVEEVRKQLPGGVPFCQVDAHNIVPCWEASPKLEYGARTIRKKIHNQLNQYFTEFPPVIKHPHTLKSPAQNVDWKSAESSLQVDTSVTEVEWAQPGTKAGLKMLENFIKQRLRQFNTDRNNPNKDALSNMSPWYHFGQVSVQRAMLEVNPFKSKFRESVDGYIEEGIIRRELADNFCYYNDQYDSIEGTNDWAKITLKAHAKDKRKHLYSREQLEKAQTHDQLWNAAQKQLVLEGKMHGFLRMYWAKKILEWTESPEKALEDSIYLNDRYSLDGRDPSGYVGCMWSVCGIHDQGWKEREIFGKIRYMNYEGCKRKFDVAAFERKYKAKKL